MQTMDKDIQSVATQLDATNASLDALMMPNQADVKKAFNSFSDNASKMESMQKDYAKNAADMKAQGKDYFAEWQKTGSTYKNPQIQQLSEQRRAELGDIYGQIAENSIGVNDAFTSYVSDVKEIQMYLSNDLTPKGIEAIAPTSRKVVDDGDSLKDAIKNVQTAIQKARESMSQTGS
jgi:predicted  nucleic acid-binding Zn-ribbon protein